MKNTVSLKLNYQFKRIYNRGSFKAGKFVVLYFLCNRLENNRLGVTLSKKIGKSVKRNRIRRLIKENFRYMEERIKKGYDLVFVARSTQSMPSYYDIRDEMAYLLKKLDLFLQE